MEAQRERKSKKKPKKFKVPKKEELDVSIPIEFTPSAPVEILEDEILKDIVESSNFVVEVSNEEPDFASSSVKYPSLNYLISAEPVAKERIEASPVTIDGKYMPQKETEVIFKCKNVRCTSCEYERKGEEPVLILKCGHFEHLECAKPDFKEIAVEKVCSFCIKLGVHPPPEPKIEENVQEDEGFSIEEANERSMRLERKKKLKSGIGGSIDEESSSDEEEESQIDTSIEDEQAVKKAKENSEIDESKIFDLLRNKNLIQTSSLWTTVDSVMALFGKGTVSKYMKDNSDNFDYNFLTKNKIKLDDLKKAEFDEDDIFYGLKIQDVRMLKHLKLKPSHFGDNGIWKDFEKFVEMYETNVNQLNEALGPMYLDWLLNISDCNVHILVKLDTDFDFLINKMVMDKEELKSTKWSVKQCKILKMTKSHLMKLKMNPLAMREMGWRDVDEIQTEFGLNEKDKQNLGMDDEELMEMLFPKKITTRRK
jgi:hypothetical protein